MTDPIIARAVDLQRQVDEALKDCKPDDPAARQMKTHMGEVMRLILAAAPTAPKRN